MSYFTIRKIDAIDSTNEALKRQYQQGNSRHGSVLWALEQTQGKGQRNSKWVSQACKNLTFSIFITHECHNFVSPFHLNCLIALSIKKVLIRLNIPEISIKWPNDILSGNKKIGGILIENSYRGAQLIGSIVGVGLNVNQETFPSFPKASSLYLQSNTNFSLEELLHQLLGTFEESFLLEKSYEEVNMEFNQALYGYQIFQHFRVDENIFKAKIEGVTKTGLLILEKERGERTTYALKEIELLY